MQCEVLLSAWPVPHTMKMSFAVLMSSAKVQRSWTSSPSRYNGKGMLLAPSPRIHTTQGNIQQGQNLSGNQACTVLAAHCLPFAVLFRICETVLLPAQTAA